MQLGPQGADCTSGLDEVNPEAGSVAGPVLASRGCCLPLDGQTKPQPEASAEQQVTVQRTMQPYWKEAQAHDQT